MANLTFLLLLCILFLGCSSLDKEGSELPAHIRGLENLTVYSSDLKPDMQIQFERETSFGSTKNTLIGMLGSIAIDEAGRIFIADPEQLTIHIFQPDGNYLTHLGRRGSGPGEFRHISNLTIHSNRLSVYDPVQLRINIYSLNSLSLSQTINLNQINQHKVEALDGFNPSRLFFRNDNRFLVGFSSIIYSDPSRSTYNLEDERQTFYYLLDNEGKIISDQILKQEKYRSLTALVNGEFRFTHFEFSGKPLLVISPEHDIYMAQSRDFLIKVKDNRGEYQRAFYYPIAKQTFIREKVIQSQRKKYQKRVADYRISVIRNAADKDLPETWPALHSMQIDNESRLWVSTIVNDFGIYQWWVLDTDDGSLLARFTWPRTRQIEVVKNGKLYTRETDEETGLQEIVRYNIIME